MSFGHAIHYQGQQPSLSMSLPDRDSCSLVATDPEKPLGVPFLLFDNNSSSTCLWLFCSCNARWNFGVILMNLFLSSSLSSHFSVFRLYWSLFFTLIGYCSTDPIHRKLVKTEPEQPAHTDRRWQSSLYIMVSSFNGSKLTILTWIRC